MNGTFKDIIIANSNGLRKIIFNIPNKKNALSALSYQEITRALNDAAKDDSVAVVAITGIGDFYSSGKNMAYGEQKPLGNIEQSAILTDFLHAFIKFPKLLIAVVNGPCIGIAATTVALCDIIIASDTAYFYTPFTLLGICAEGCSSYTFPKILGRSKANEMLLLNHKMYAEEALKFNFISEIYTTSEVETKIWPKIENYAKLPKASLRATKKLINQFEMETLEKVCQIEIEELNIRKDSEECRNGMLNFIHRKSKL